MIRIRSQWSIYAFITSFFKSNARVACSTLRHLFFSCMWSQKWYILRNRSSINPYKSELIAIMCLAWRSSWQAIQCTLPPASSASVGCRKNFGSITGCRNLQRTSQSMTTFWTPALYETFLRWAESQPWRALPDSLRDVEDIFQGLTFCPSTGERRGNSSPILEVSALLRKMWAFLAPTVL